MSAHIFKTEVTNGTNGDTGNPSISFKTKRDKWYYPKEGDAYKVTRPNESPKIVKVRTVWDYEANDGSWHRMIFCALPSGRVLRGEGGNGEYFHPTHIWEEIPMKEFEDKCIESDRVNAYTAAYFFPLEYEQVYPYRSYHKIRELEKAEAAAYPKPMVKGWWEKLKDRFKISDKERELMNQELAEIDSTAPPPPSPL
jgi:hypothetical protein